MMKVNIYYGGRGLIEDPTIYVINKLTEVLKELRVEVIRYNLHEEKHSMSALTRTLKECDGVILATTVEWLGIGGLMQQFLDDCWLYADKEHLANVYMLPVVTSMTYGEKDAEYTLIKAWDMLGGVSCRGISAYVENHVEFETNPDYGFLIEKEAEGLYRSISQKRTTFPCSSNAVKKNVLRKNTLNLTPQESEQLSVYVSNDSYVKKQKEDIEELAQLFKEMLGDTGKKEENTEPVQEKKPAGTRGFETRVPESLRTKRTSETIDSNLLAKELAEAAAQMGAAPISSHPARLERDKYFARFQDRFRRGTGISASFSIFFTDDNRNLVIEVSGDELNCYHGNKEDADIIAKTTTAVLDDMFAGKMSMQRAFMTGALTAKGNFKTLRSFDTLFNFN